jgi:hypothetical protein|tara:strand:- start:30 stop:659 length:630 start_codon:yes stop_codon:yes gene_type:complete
LRSSSRDSDIVERVGAFLRFLAGPITYDQGVVDARTKAMERGSRIPGLPEFGLSEGFESYVNQAKRDLGTAFPEQQSVQEKVSEVADSGQGEYQYPRVVAQTEREKETDRMVDLILNLPETKAEAAAKVDYEALARENFRRNNPALESMPDEEAFLFNRYKRNLASKLAKKGVTVEEAQGNPEQAFLANQLERYLAEEPDTRRGRQRGF